MRSSFNEKVYRVHKIQVSVIDSGIGIKREHINKLFKLFGRLDHSSNNSSVGLGLTIVKRIVEQMGGYVSVRSIYKQGTVFSFYVLMGVLD